MRVKPIRDDYLKLIQKFPLRVIHNERELDAATKVALQLAAKGEDALSAGEIEYLDVLDRLIEDYENHVPGVRGDCGGGRRG